MMNPELLLRAAEAQHRKKLQEAEFQRLCRQIRESRPGMLQQVGDRLIAARQKLKAQTQPRTSTPVARVR